MDWDDKPGKPRLVIPVGFGVFGPKNSKNSRTGMTTLGTPRLSSQSVSGFSGRKGQKKPEMDWDDNPGKPRLVIPKRFGVFWPKRGNKNPKRTGMTTLGSPGLSLSPFRVFLANKGTGMTTLGRPGLSSQSISGFSGRKEPRKPETDWDDNHGKPKLVIPVRVLLIAREYYLVPASCHRKSCRDKPSSWGPAGGLQWQLFGSPRHRPSVSPP